MRHLGVSEPEQEATALAISIIERKTGNGAKKNANAEKPIDTINPREQGEQ